MKLITDLQKEESMTREEVKYILPILQAFADGKEIESRVEDKWYKVLEICNEMNPQDYRIKPEPKYRSFANAEECLQEMLKHQPFGWIKAKEGGYQNIISVDNFYAGLGDKDGSAILLASKNSYQDNTFFDGTPFGIKLEE